MSSRFIPPKDGSISSTACTISTASRARMQSGTAPTPPNSLKRRALPSMTGKPASGPISDAILLAFFDRRHVAIAGVVDEHIDAAENPFGFGHGAPDLVSAGHVESESLRFRFIADDQIGDFVRIARRSDGAVTRTEFGRAQFGSPSSGSGRGGGSPRLERFFSEDVERVAGSEMALDVEGVENGGVNGQEALG